MKQITIYDLLPLLKKGWVAYAPKSGWMWFDKKPRKLETMWMLDYHNWEFIYTPRYFKELAPFDGDWKDSLIRIDHFHQQGKMVEEEDTLLMVDKSTGPEWYKNGKRIK